MTDMTVTIAHIKTADAIQVSQHSNTLAISYTNPHRASLGRTYKVLIEGEALRDLITALKKAL
jgi:hypothetical protein